MVRYRYLHNKFQGVAGMKIVQIYLNFLIWYFKDTLYRYLP